MVPFDRFLVHCTVHIKHNYKFQDLGTPNEKIWPGLSELPAMKKCSFGNFADHPYNTLRQKFGSYLTDTGFDLLNRYSKTE